MAQSNNTFGLLANFLSAHTHKVLCGFTDKKSFQKYVKILNWSYTILANLLLVESACQGNHTMVVFHMFTFEVLLMSVSWLINI